MTKSEARRRALVVLLVLALAIAMTATASAQRRGYAPTPPEPDTRAGISMVSEVDARTGTLIVDDVAYGTDERTSIRRHSGQPVTLASIRVPRPSPGRLVATHEVDFIRFEAEKIGGRWIMRSITILEEPPR